LQRVGFGSIGSGRGCWLIAEGRSEKHSVASSKAGGREAAERETLDVWKGSKRIPLLYSMSNRWRWRRSVERSILAFFKFGEGDSRNLSPQFRFYVNRRSQILKFFFSGRPGSLPMGALLLWGPVFSSGGVGPSNEPQQAFHIHVIGPGECESFVPVRELSFSFEDLHPTCCVAAGAR
jgi:hypothetical protein